MENIIEQAEKVNSKNLILEDIPCTFFIFYKYNIIKKN